MAWLEYGGRLRKLPEGRAVVGSGAEATFQVEDAELMPRHLILEPVDDGAYVRACSSDVVVAVSGRQIGTEQHFVRYGEPVHAGSAEFRIWREQPSAPRHDSPAAPPRAFLLSLHEQAAYPLDRAATPIGRASSNFVRLSDPTASRFHAQVRREAGGFTLYVSGSAGGAVNGRRVGGPRLLGEGDEIELAYARFRFTRGPVPEGMRIIPSPPPGGPEVTERPTAARDRISLAQATPGQPPRILRTAVIVGVVLAIAAGILALVLLTG